MNFQYGIVILKLEQFPVFTVEPIFHTPEDGGGLAELRVCLSVVGTCRVSSTTLGPTPEAWQTYFKQQRRALVLYSSDGWSVLNLPNNAKPQTVVVNQIERKLDEDGQPIGEEMLRVEMGVEARVGDP